MKSLIDHAIFEVYQAGLYNENSIYPELVPDSIIKVVRIYQNIEQERGELMSKSALELVIRLVNLEPLTPLLGDEDEWTKNDLLGPNGYQNNRFPRVVKIDEKAFDMQGVLHEGCDGTTYISDSSWVPIEFPYIPKQIIVSGSQSPEENVALTWLTQRLLKRRCLNDDK